MAAFKKGKSTVTHFKFLIGCPGEHWWRTIIRGEEIWGEINRFALKLFSNFALYKRYQPSKFKICNFLSS